MVNFKGRLKGVQRMLDARRDEANKTDGAVIYTGDWHDSIPRRLILDPSLTPVEKLTWQIIRTHIGQPGEDGAWPSVGRIARLAGVSRPTIQNAIDVLEASRWISVLRRVRDDHGNVIGNYYMLHGSPMPVAETMAFTPGYLSMLKRMSKLNGPSKRRVSKFAKDMLKELNYSTEKVVQAEPLPEVQKIKENLDVNQIDGRESILDPVVNSLVAPVVQAEPLPEATEVYEWSNKLDITLHTRANDMLMKVPITLRKIVVENFNLSLEKGGVRNPLSYLSSLVERVKNGTFIDVIDRSEHSSLEKQLWAKLTQAKQVLDQGGRVLIRGREVDMIYGFNISFKQAIREGVYTVNASFSKILPKDIILVSNKDD